MTRFYYDAQGREHESGDWDAETARSEPRAEGLRALLLDRAEQAHIFGPDHPAVLFDDCPYEPCVAVRAALAATPPAEGLVLVRKDSGGVFPDGTTNTPAIDFDAPVAATPPAEGLVTHVTNEQVIDQLRAEIMRRDDPVPLLALLDLLAPEQPE